MLQSVEEVGVLEIPILDANINFFLVSNWLISVNGVMFNLQSDF